MVCGVTISSSRTQRGGPHGNHEILPLRVTMPDGDVRLLEVVTTTISMAESPRRSTSLSLLMGRHSFLRVEGSQPVFMTSIAPRIEVLTMAGWWSTALSIL